MKISNWFYLLATMSIIFSLGCSEKVEVEKKTEIRPVKTILVAQPDSGGIRNFPGRVDANKKAELAFRVSGKVQELLAKEGDLVKKGDVIAKLDPTDFQITVNNKRAFFSRSQKDFNRGKKLVKAGHISKVDFDKLESIFLSSKADLNLAKQQLPIPHLASLHLLQQH